METDHIEPGTDGDRRTELLSAGHALAGQPLFVLSTAGQELFHTNFLYWLAREYTDSAAAPVFKALRMPLTTNGQCSANVIRREYKHVDLYFDAGMGSYKLVLENKLAAIADPGQLDRYAQLFGYALDTSFTLLTLLPSGSVPEPWAVVRYDDLVQPLAEAAASVDDQFDRSLIERYRDLVRGLIALRDAVSPSGGALGHARWALSAEERRELGEVRVLPLVEKMRALILAREIRARLSADLPLEVSLSNTQGLVSYYAHPDQNGHQLGWQLQGRQFRLAAATRDDPRLNGRRLRAEREEFVSRAFPGHFDFAAVDTGRILIPARSRKDWLGFDPDFVYRYKTVSETATWEQVIELAVHAVTHSDRA